MVKAVAEWSARALPIAAAVWMAGVRHPLASAQHPMPDDRPALQAQPALRDESVHLLIVAPSGLMHSLGDFVAFKQARLGSAELVILEEAINAGELLAREHSEQYTDDAARLKHYLFDRWERDHSTHVLLVGDADVLPVRYMVLDRKTEPAFDFAFYPSDLYYADLARRDGSFDDWNAQKDGFHRRYFGEVRGEANKDDPINFDGVDYRPEIAVGRWPVSDEETAGAVAAKSMRYELALEIREGQEQPIAALIAVDGWVDARGNLDRFAARIEPGWKVEKRYYHDGSTDAAAPPEPDETQLVELFNRGVDLMIHTGHGHDHAWAECLSTSSLTKIEGSDRLPVLFSVGCSTARFATLPPYEAYMDASAGEHAGTNNGEVFTAPPPPPSPYATGQYNMTGLGESFLRSPDRGCVAYIGCNTGSQPCALTLLDGFAAELARQREDGSPVRVGDCWSATISHYYEAERLETIKPDAGWYPASIFFQGMKFMLFGDPTLPLGR